MIKPIIILQYVYIIIYQIDNVELGNPVIFSSLGCRTFPEGDIVSWRDRDWTIVGKPQVTIMETYDLGQLRAQLWLKSYQILFILLHVLIKSDPSSFTNERPNMETC